METTAAQKQAPPAPTVTHGTVAGVARKVDKESKQIVVETEGKASEVIHLTEKTAVKTAKMAAKGASAVAKETVHLADASWDSIRDGSHVVARFSEEAGKKTADTIHDFGSDALHAASGTVEDIGEEGKKVTVKTADGAKHVFETSEHVIVDKGSGAATETGKAIKKGAAATVHFTEAGGRKIAHLFKF